MQIKKAELTKRDFTIAQQCTNIEEKAGRRRIK
jgi:hypothetical protein